LNACDGLFVPLGPGDLDLDAFGSLGLERSGSALSTEAIAASSAPSADPSHACATRPSFAHTPLTREGNLQ
jgi:hypothetical protein